MFRDIIKLRLCARAGVVSASIVVSVGVAQGYWSRFGNHICRWLPCDGRRYHHGRWLCCVRWCCRWDCWRQELLLLTFILIYCSFIYHTRKLEKLGVFHFRFFICKVNHLCRRLKEESREWLSMTCEWNLKKCSNQREQRGRCSANYVNDNQRV
jgi:hypothetical protein